MECDLAVSIPKIEASIVTFALSISGIDRSEMDFERIPFAHLAVPFP